jgi:hypothetical protein
MNVRLFVTGTACLLAAWLVATFLSEVPVDTYIQSGPGSVPVSAKAVTTPAKPVASAAATGKGDASVGRN